jgi:hypothetical protein
MVIVVCVVAGLATHARADDQSIGATASRTLNRVNVNFVLKNPIITADESLTVIISFQNQERSTVVFRYFDLLDHARLYTEEGVAIEFPDAAGIYESPAFEVRLGPHERRIVTESLDLFRWYHLRPGKYKIRFVYPLSLLDKSTEKVVRRHERPDAYGFCPWDRRSYRFTVRP